MRQKWLCFSFAFLCLQTISAADWSQFRGDRGDGVTPVVDLPKTWSDTTNVKWRCELPGEGWSSPVVLGNRVYMTSAIPTKTDAPSTERELVLLEVDAVTGKLTRQTKIFTQPSTAPKIHSKNSHASPTPILDSDRVYVHFGHSGTACLTLDGQVIWAKDDLSYKPVHGNGGSPVLVGNALIFSQDSADRGQVLALHRDTGKVLWELARNVDANKTFSFCTPMVMEESGETVVVIPGSNVVQCISVKTGKEQWRVRYEGYSVIPRPIVAAGHVMVCTGYDRPTLLAIRPGGSGDVTDSHVAWQTNVAVPHTPSLLTYQGMLFMISDAGVASCLDAKTGEVLWKQRIGGNYSASPLLVGDVIYFLSEDGEATLVQAAAEFKELQRNRLPDRTLASMAVIGSDLLIRSKQSLWRISH